MPTKKPPMLPRALKTAPSPKAVKMPFISAPPRSPALRTSAQATPSGYLSSFCSTIMARRKGIIMVTPMTPPESAMRVVSQNLNSVQIPVTTRAGTVKMIPAARLSPELAMVCTMLFSRIVPRLSRPRRMPMEITLAGIAALTVMPALSPTYMLAAHMTRLSSRPSTTACKVNSGRVFPAGT